MDPFPGLGEELLSVDEVARYLEMQPVTIYRWCREGRLPCMKLGKVWRIRRGALEAFLRRAERPQTLTAHLGAFFTVPDQILAVAQDAALLARLDAAFYQVAEARDGLLVKFYDPRIVPRDELKAGFRRDGLDIDRLEASGRFRWCPERDPAGEVASLRRLVEEAAASWTVWAGFNWSGEGDLTAMLQQHAELAALVAAHPLAVMNGMIEPAMQDWPAAELQWQLLGSLRGVIRYAHTGLLLSRVVWSLEA